MSKTVTPQNAKTFSEYWDSFFATTTTKIPMSFIYLAFEHFCNICFVVRDFSKLEFAWKNENPLPLPRITFEEKLKELAKLHVLSGLQKPKSCNTDSEELLILIPEEKKELNLHELLKNQIGRHVYHILFGEVIIQKIYDNILVMRSPTFKIYEDMLTADGKSRYTGEQMLFPSKDQRDWSKCNPCQFKDGEIVWAKCFHNPMWYALYHTGKMNDENNHIVYQHQDKIGYPTIVVEDCRPFSKIPF